ncbi:hypothetical protein RRG08_007971 [Elysia crispata]|uniref:Uncharacterized protein n=1 Tax=Elysia crispata TaxID=231223 RepID=A0AAE0ZQ27_9GAST|nr:hypothetical protein RRG08_007971 [Elysia crispata]
MLCRSGRECSLDHTVAHISPYSTWSNTTGQISPWDKTLYLRNKSLPRKAKSRISMYIMLVLIGAADNPADRSCVL